MLDFTSRLTYGSAVSYVAWRTTGRKRPVVLKLKTGPRFELREEKNNDYGVAWEVFVHDFYN